MLSYCFVCKNLTDNANTKKFIIKDGRLKIKSLCTLCDNKKVKYISKWSSSLNNLIINYKYEQRKQLCH